MKLLTYSLLLPLALSAQTSTHDDPIIVDKGSVRVSFGLHTRGLPSQGLFPQQTTVGGSPRFLYYQHTHLAAKRLVQSLYLPPGNLQFKTSKATTLDLDTAQKQKDFRVEIYLKAKPVNSTAYVSLGSTPQIIITSSTTPVPCCAHREGLVTGPADMCPAEVSIPRGHSKKHKDYPYSLVVSTDIKLTQVALQSNTARGNPLLQMKYLDPRYSDIQIDHWNYGLPAPGAVYQPTFTSRNANGTSKFKDCPSIEVCAVEQGSKQNGLFCERAPGNCLLNATDASNPLDKKKFQQ